MDGYLSYWKFTDDLVGAKVDIHQFWETLDGIEIFGTMQRSLDSTGDKCYKGAMESEDTPYIPADPLPDDLNP